MSKNTGTSELINYFDLGANGDVGIAGSLDVNTIANATTDTDTFLVSDTGIIKYRTGAQLLSDIGAQGLLTNPVTGTGTSGTIPVFTGSTTIGNSIIQSNATQVNIVGNGSQLLFDSLGSAKDGGIQYVNDFTLQMYNSRGVGSSIYLGNNNLDLNINPSSNPRLRITSGGNVLINSTTDNGARLQVSGTATVSSSVTASIFDSTSNAFRFNGSNALSLVTLSSQSVVKINAAGYWGSQIVGANDQGLLINNTGAATFSSSVTIAASTFLNWGVRGGISQDGSFNFNWSTNGVANAFHLQSATGNVGIGTTNPIYTLHAKAASGSTTGLRLESSGGTTNFDILSSEGDGNAYLYQRSNYGILIGTNNTLRMTITAGGNVGIGTGSPDANSRLDVNGQTFVGHLAIYNNNGTPSLGTSPMLYSPASGTIAISTNVAERMRITSGGNVLIGTTTNSSGKLQVLGADGTVISQIKSASAMVQIYSYFGAYGGPIIQALDGGAVGYVPLRIEASSTTFNSSVNINGNIELPSGVNRQIIIGSVTNYNYRLKTDGDDFAISEAGNTDRLRYSYTNVRWTITGGLTISGSLSKGSGSFKIDHPLPEKKDTHQLVHSFIEGPKADLIYRGKLTLINGKAQANIDEASTMTEGTFDVLCRDVQCFTTNETGWDLVKGKVVGNVIYIESQNTNSTDEISWMVIGERKDKHMIDTDWTDENGKVIVEPLKK